MWSLLSLALAAPPSWIDDSCKLIPQGGEDYQVMCRSANVTIQHLPAALGPAEALKSNVAGYKSVGLPPGFELGAESALEWKGAAAGHVLEMKTPAGPSVFSFTLVRAHGGGNRIASCTAPGVDRAGAQAACKEALDWVLANGAPTEHLKPAEVMGPKIRDELPDYKAPNGCTLQEAPQQITAECVTGMVMVMVAPPQLDIADTPRKMRDEMVSQMPAAMGKVTAGEAPCKVLGADTTCYLVEHSAGKIAFGSTRRASAGLMVQCAWGASGPLPCKGLIEGL